MAILLSFDKNMMVCYSIGALSNVVLVRHSTEAVGSFVFVQSNMPFMKLFLEKFPFCFVFSLFSVIFAFGLIRPRGDEVYFCGLNNSVCCLFDNNVPEVWPRKELHYRINK